MPQAGTEDEINPASGRPVDAAVVIGVLGAGTMGSGIAQLAARSGASTLLYDPIEQALERGLAGARDGLAKEAAKGRLDGQAAQDAAQRLEAVDSMSAFSSCELVIEAAPERIELKHELYRELAGIVSPQCVLASNTSSLPITKIAAAVDRPERVVGMHFFNPAPLMALLEIVAGVLSDERSLAVADATGRAMGKQTIRAADVPGFLVNRCNRPFGLEALRLLAERIADVETIDRVVRMEGAFKMGPFELSDLVGVDTGFDVALSFYELSFGEPRWRPSPIQARRVAAGLLGRKTGRGYYDYGGGASGEAKPAPRGVRYRSEDPAPLVAGAPGDGEGVVVIAGEGVLAGELRAAAEQAGYEVRSPHTPSGGVLPALQIDCDPTASVREREQPPGRRRGDRRETTQPGGARVLLCATGSLSVLDPGGSAVGFHVLPPFGETGLVELTRNDGSSPLAAARAERFFAALGKHTEWVGDAPGLVLGRIVCQIINECAFSLGEGVGSAQDIDTGMLLGLSHPRGPLAWADAIGLDHVLAVLDALSDEYREERYRPAPTLRRLVAAGSLGQAAGAGFFEHDAGG
jgi:3-hydroxybutyryl-CoA dehydrogenase